MLSQIALTATKSFSTLLNTLHLDKFIRNNNDVRLVFYHGIGNKNTPCMKFLNDEICESTFKSQLDYLQNKYKLVSLDDVITYYKHSEHDALNKPLCSISFDDGLSTVYSKAFPLLKKKNIPFSVFLNTSVIENINLLWLHVLGYLFTTYGVSDVAHSINSLLGKCLSKVPEDAKGIEDWCRTNMEYVYESSLLTKLAELKTVNIEEVAIEQNMYLTWLQIEEMASHGVTFYSHTHQHFPLNAFTNERHIKSEIKEALATLAKHPDLCKIDFISFPFGMEIDYGKKAIEHAISAGHDYVVEVGDGLNTKNRVIHDKIISRVGLGNVSADNAALYCSLELWPVVKHYLKSFK